MPHQCLNCGEVFEDGSPHLLKGCPKCGGKRFFYIKKPLSEEERERVKREVETEIEERFREIFQKNLREVEPDDIKAVLEKLSEEREKRLRELMEGEKEEPETITIEEPGRYKLDLKGLLEEEIIIIQKDGSYTIHLPSLFSMVRKEDS
ncbi:MAG TPA: hypothetical protein ENG60_00285 [Thermoplasmatales archaeon]|nr:hypothetical protein [Thermoplasmatales archaeon]HEX16846.1 hypothetical protein [Thermoplasmatales archaeon]